MLKYVFRIKFCSKIVHQIDPNSALLQVFVTSSFLYVCCSQDCPNEAQIGTARCSHGFSKSNLHNKGSKYIKYIQISRLSANKGCQWHQSLHQTNQDCYGLLIAPHGIGVSCHVSPDGIIWCRHPLADLHCKRL